MPKGEGRTAIYKASAAADIPSVPAGAFHAFELRRSSQLEADFEANMENTRLILVAMLILVALRESVGADACDEGSDACAASCKSRGCESGDCDVGVCKCSQCKAGWCRSCCNCCGWGPSTCGTHVKHYREPAKGLMPAVAENARTLVGDWEHFVWGGMQNDAILMSAGNFSDTPWSKYFIKDIEFSSSVS
ncbi:unnamed protein product [Darwinula stevensoni]|uniref:Uncharacterized protein n=1 Tax=Darwinula stevensoni TaxID=69355 RepID=A0A7R9A9Z4_9CRUS|nr:unnamed protein product [Darwinula stevensoni]CAG0897918.1 unnamed protein product [Darwinula stevensoni]